MNNMLDLILKHIAEEFQADIVAGSRNYVEVDIGKHAGILGFSDLAKRI